MRIADDLDIILQLIDRIQQTVARETESSFGQSIDAIDAVAYRLSMIGEHCKRLPQDLKERHPDVPWSDMAGLRNIVAHGYDNVSPSIVWETATQDLDPVYKMATEERFRLALDLNADERDISSGHKL